MCRCPGIIALNQQSRDASRLLFPTVGDACRCRRFSVHSNGVARTPAETGGKEEDDTALAPRVYT